MGMSSKKEQFRPDIQLLRALSILLVVLCHYNLKGFSFGFIGVDIFFVISGFLISQSLYREFLSHDESGDNSRTISLATFYMRRIRRLLPAALTVIILVNLISFFLYNAEIRSKLASDSKWAFIFLANVTFLRSQSNYFQMGSQPSFLEHYWSLSVEEQFYAIWPLLFLLAATFKRFKFRRRLIRYNQRLLIIFSAVILGSYLFLQIGFYSSPVQSYFSLFSRAWELGVGGLFGILALQKRKTTIFSTAERFTPFFISLLISSLFINQSNWANLVILPVFSTAFLMYSGDSDLGSKSTKQNKSNALLKLCLHLGGISYSLYLVHWPIYVIASRDHLTDKYLYKVCLIFFSVFCAHLLWKYVEKPFQKIPISKKLQGDIQLFNFLKTRRKIVNILILLIVGSLFIVSIPPTGSSQLTSKENNSIQSSNVKNFAYYESQLISAYPNIPTEQSKDSSTSQAQPQTANINFESLFAANQAKLKSSLVDLKLNVLQMNELTRAASDFSSIEQSICTQNKYAIPPSECINNSNVSTKKKVLLLGDSKMGMLLPALYQYFQDKGWLVQTNVMNGCLLSYGYSRFNKSTCTERYNWTIDFLVKNKFDLIIISEYPSIPDVPAIQSKFYDSVEQSANKVLFIGNMAQITKPTECLTNSNELKVSCAQIDKNELRGISWTKQNIMSRSNKKWVFFESSQLYCVNNDCPILVNGLFVFRDGIHLTATYVKTLVPLINAFLDSINVI